MASFDFRSHEEPWVVFAPRNSELVEAEIRSLQEIGGEVYHFDAKNLRDRRGVFQAFATQLSFPGYFGQNWDAMIDCLGDLCGQVTGGVGLVGVIHGADLLDDPEHLKTLVSVLCYGAMRANSSVDEDGDEEDRPRTRQHFVFLMAPDRQRSWRSGWCIPNSPCPKRAVLC